jgi:hypothetical protein
MAAKVTDRLWEIGDIVKMVEARGTRVALEESMIALRALALIIVVSSCSETTVGPPDNPTACAIAHSPASNVGRTITFVGSYGRDYRSSFVHIEDCDARPRLYGISAHVETTLMEVYYPPLEERDRPRKVRGTFSAYVMQITPDPNLQGDDGVRMTIDGARDLSLVWSD